MITALIIGLISVLAFNSMRLGAKNFDNNFSTALFIPLIISLILFTTLLESGFSAPVIPQMPRLDEAMPEITSPVNNKGVFWPAPLILLGAVLVLAKFC